MSIYLKPKVFLVGASTGVVAEVEKYLCGARNGPGACFGGFYRAMGHCAQAGPLAPQKIGREAFSHLTNELVYG
jgi:hypothetical protein